MSLGHFGIGECIKLEVGGGAVSLKKAMPLPDTQPALSTLHPAVPGLDASEETES